MLMREIGRGRRIVLASKQRRQRGKLLMRRRGLAMLAGPLLLGGCAAMSQPSPPVAVDQACRGLRPYSRDTSHLDRQDRIWVAGHNAWGKSYCGEEWLRKP